MNDSVNIFSVTGMTCEGCVQTIKTKLELESEISKADISLSSTKLIIHSSKKYQSEELNKIIKSVGNYTFDIEKNVNSLTSLFVYFRTYKPIFISLSFVVILSIISSFNELFNIKDFLRFFMGYFFIIFSFLKLHKVRQFAVSFSNYDPITKKIPNFGRIYPFIELILGTLFLLNFFTLFINFVTIIILLPQTYGIYNKLMKKEKILCACLGTSFEIPLSKLTIIENLTMCSMATIMIVIYFNLSL